MWTLSNAISLSRVPLAFAFLQENVQIRIAAILLALFTDFLDGYLARRNKAITRIGTIIDPLTDKFFVLFALITLTIEQQLAFWKVLSMFSRDFAIVLFGFWLFLKSKLFEYRPRAILFGKITTGLQLLVLIALTALIPIPGEVFVGFIFLGIFSFIELMLR